MGLPEVNSESSGCTEHQTGFPCNGNRTGWHLSVELKQRTAKGRGYFHFFSNQICFLKGRIQIRKDLKCHRNANCMVLAERIRESSLAGLRGTE